MIPCFCRSVYCRRVRISNKARVRATASRRPSWQLLFWWFVALPAGRGLQGEYWCRGCCLSGAALPPRSPCLSLSHKFSHVHFSFPVAPVLLFSCPYHTAPTVVSATTGACACADSTPRPPDAAERSWRRVAGSKEQRRRGVDDREKRGGGGRRLWPAFYPSTRIVVKASWFLFPFLPFILFATSAMLLFVEVGLSFLVPLILVFDCRVAREWSRGGWLC